MPNNINFSNLRDVKTLEVSPDGWVTPLYIEYGIGNDLVTYGTVSYYWRVKGTKHTFVIPLVRLDYLSAGDYKKHFEEALNTFREDYLQWKSEGFNSPWAKEYQKQFSQFIL